MQAISSFPSSLAPRPIVLSEVETRLRWLFDAMNQRIKFCPITLSRPLPLLCKSSANQKQQQKPIRHHQKNAGHPRAVSRNTPKTSDKFAYKGIRYRSFWEVEVACLLDSLLIDFEYERLDLDTQTKPDFYITGMQCYLELHLDCWGDKKLPQNCVLVKSKAHAKAAIMAFGFAIKPSFVRYYLHHQVESRTIKGLLRTLSALESNFLAGANMTKAGGHKYYPTNEWDDSRLIESEVQANIAVFGSH